MAVSKIVLSLNINDHVRVKLTDAGRAVHKANHERLFATANFKIDYVAPKEDENGWSTWQMWKLMGEFGAYMTQGNMHLPFETDILIETGFV